MIPKIIHFVYFYSKESPMPLNINHYLCVKSQAVVNTPDKIFIWTNDPVQFYEFPWMRRLMIELEGTLEIMPVERLTDYKGNRIISPMQESDIFRFNLMKIWGGLYLDLDVMAVNPIPDEYWEFELPIQAEEPDRRQVCGLGSAVMMSPRGATWWDTVLAPYENYDREIKKGKFELPIYRPYRIGMQHPELVRIIPSHHFFPVYFFYDECEELFYLDRLDKIARPDVYQLHLWENRSKVVMKYFSESYFLESNATYAQLGKRFLPFRK